MSGYQIAAAGVAFVALGANLMGTALLLLFNPRSATVRWYVVFVVLQLIWLGLQAVRMVSDLPPAAELLFALDIHFMPAVFTAAALVKSRGGRTEPVTFVPIIVAVLVLPLMGGAPLDSALTPLWHAVGWGAGAVFYWVDRREGAARGAGLLNGALTITVPFGVVGAILFGGAFLAFMLPLMTIVLQYLIFVGVVYHRYYDIDVRVARTGQLAAGAAERDRLALLGEISATMAHEVRNPLTGIRSLTQRLAEGPVDDERRARYTGIILGEIERLDRIVGQLGEFTRQNQRVATTESVELTLLFEDLSLLLEARAKSAGVRMLTRTDVLAVRVARDHLAQALLNLLLNAISHSPAGGTVELGSARERSGVTLYVRDNGPGVPHDARQRIFDAFHTGSGGSGLGLAVVRRLADDQGWSVDVTDAPGGGAEFRIHLMDGVA